jgi:hypothetical protein
MNFLLIILIIFSFDNVNSANNCDTPIEAGSNLCQKCATGYALNKDRTCSQCGKDEVSQDNYCFTKIEHCKTYKLYQEGQKCEECENKYYEIEDNRACRLDIDNCAEYENNEKCRRCEAGYLLNNAKTKCIGNCAELDSNDNCKKCTDGYAIITEENSQAVEPYCILIMEGCKEIETNQPSNCKNCMDGYLKKEDNSCKFDGCREYTTDDTPICSSCYSNHTKIDDNCYYIEGCDEIVKEDSGTNIICKQCKGDYSKLEDNTCKKIENCKTYDDTDLALCKECNEGYKLSEDKNYCPTAINNCKKYGIDYCQECNDNYETYDHGETCEYTRLPNCINQVNNECQQCETYYVIKEKKCVECDNTEGKSCGVTIENCQKYKLKEETKTVECTACSSGFTLKYGLCINDKAANGNTISSTIDNCVYYSTENKCGKCTSGYELINDKCYACPAPYNEGNGVTCSLPHLNCLIHDNSGNCIACSTGYQFTRNHQYCIEEGTNDPTKNNNSCVLNLNILILMLFAILL